MWKMEFFLLNQSREVTPIKKNIWQNVILVIFRISSGLFENSENVKFSVWKKNSVFQQLHVSDKSQILNSEKLDCFTDHFFFYFFVFIYF